MKLKNLFALFIVLFAIIQVARYFLSEPTENNDKVNTLSSEQENRQNLEKAKAELLESIDAENDATNFTELDPIFVNLPSPNKRGGERSVEVVLIVQYADPSVESALESNKFFVRDRIITALSLRDPNQLLDLSNRPDITKELTLVLNAIFEPDLVQLFISANRDKYRNSEHISKLQEFGVLPNDQSLKITPEIISTSKQLTNKSFPIRNILFKEIKIN
jgi:flagellar basal body-associated protein FliL